MAAALLQGMLDVCGFPCQRELSVLAVLSSTDQPTQQGSLSRCAPAWAAAPFSQCLGTVQHRSASAAPFSQCLGTPAHASRTCTCVAHACTCVAHAFSQCLGTPAHALRL